MSLTVSSVYDAKAALGPSRYQHMYQAAPGTSDYPTSGYPITSAQLGLGNLYGATVIAGNAASTAYAAKFVLPSGSFGTTPQPGTQVNMVVTQSDTQVGANTDLSACKWIILVEAQGE